jgi:hypothetical protein
VQDPLQTARCSSYITGQDALGPLLSRVARGEQHSRMRCVGCWQVANCLACGKVYDCRGTFTSDTTAFVGVCGCMQPAPCIVPYLLHRQLLAQLVRESM